MDYELTLLPGARRLEEPRPPAGRGRVVILSQEMKSNWRLGLLEDRAVQGGTGSGRLQQGEETCDRKLERKERWSCSGLGGGGVAVDRYPGDVDCMLSTHAWAGADPSQCNSTNRQNLPY